MSGSKPARQTAKMRKAVTAYAAMNEINPAFLKRDRNSIDLMYTALAKHGFQWIPEKQEWAFIPEPEADKAYYATIAVTENQVGDFSYIVCEALRAAGCKVELSDVIPSPFERGIAIIGIRIEA